MILFDDQFEIEIMVEVELDVDNYDDFVVLVQDLLLMLLLFEMLCLISFFCNVDVNECVWFEVYVGGLLVKWKRYMEVFFVFLVLLLEECIEYGSLFVFV